MRFLRFAIFQVLKNGGASCTALRLGRAIIAITRTLARPGFLTAIILAFAHTVGEFGVVLMLGGNIEGETRVLSVAIYNHVEAMEYSAAHWLAGGMVLFSFLVLLGLYLAGGKSWQVRK